MLSASLTRGADGDSTFVYRFLLDRDQNVMDAVGSAVRFIAMTDRLRRNLGPIGIYAPLNAPYWPTVLCPFLTKIRRIGLDASIVQQPLLGSGKWERFIEDNVKVLMIPDPPELGRSETKFLTSYVRKGGSIVVLGYPPEGLRQLLGIESRNVGKYGGLKLLKPTADRIPADLVRRFGFELVFCATLTDAEPMAVYESIPRGFQPGAFAITRVRRNKGSAFFIGIPSLVILESVPEVLLDVLDSALSGSGLNIPWEIEGLSEDCDLMSGEEFLIAVNLSMDAVEATARYRGNIEEKSVEFIGKGSELKGSGKSIELKLSLNPYEPTGVILLH